MSAINVIACIAYLAVSLLCLGAGLAASARGDRKGHLLSWAVCSIVFALMIASRIFGWEEFAREAWRSLLAENDFVSRRQYLQKPLVAASIIVGTLVIYGGWLYARAMRARPSDFYVRLAQITLLMLVPLFALRIISLHAFDRLLYAGPVRINWILDGGITVATGVLAGYYIMRHRRRLAPGSNSS